MDGSPQPRTRNAAATREAILASARDRFARYSYDDVGLRDIAGDAGVDAAMIHRYFGSKDDLLSATLDSCEVGHDLFDGPRETFGQRVADEIVRRCKSGEQLQGMQIMLHSIGSAKAAQIVQASAQTDFFAPFEAWLGGPDTAVRVRILAGLIMGMGISRELGGGFGLPDSEADRLCDRLADLIQSMVDDT